MLFILAIPPLSTIASLMTGFKQPLNSLLYFVLFLSFFHHFLCDNFLHPAWSRIFLAPYLFLTRLTSSVIWLQPSFHCRCRTRPYLFTLLLPIILPINLTVFTKFQQLPAWFICVFELFMFHLTTSQLLKLASPSNSCMPLLLIIGGFKVNPARRHQCWIPDQLSTRHHCFSHWYHFVIPGIYQNAVIKNRSAPAPPEYCITHVHPIHKCKCLQLVEIPIQTTYWSMCECCVTYLLIYLLTTNPRYSYFVTLCKRVRSDSVLISGQFSVQEQKGMQQILSPYAEGQKCFQLVKKVQYK